MKQTLAEFKWEILSIMYRSVRANINAETDLEQYCRLIGPHRHKITLHLRAVEYRFSSTQETFSRIEDFIDHRTSQEI